jgi:AraC-like DNA-binding protein
MIFSPEQNLLNVVLINVQVLLYAIAALIRLNVYRRELKNNFSTLDRINLHWLSFILYGFLIANLFWFFKHYLYEVLGVYSELLVILRITCFSVFALTIIYKSLKYPFLFSDSENLSRPAKQPMLSMTIFEKYKSELLNTMESQKPYLHPDITLSKLSRIVAIPARSLSEVIKRGFQKNFFDFINHFRIREAQHLIHQSAFKKHKTMLEILYEVGYNNKSVFNSSFKKYTGITPTQYRSSLGKYQKPLDKKNIKK